MKIKPGLGELLRYLIELTDDSADQYYKHLGFNYRPRYTPIMRVLQSGAVSVTELKEKLSVTQGAISQTIKLMLADDLIVKDKGKDARQSIISLSDHGKDVLQHLIPHWKSTFLAIEQLESEINFPLMSLLQQTVTALEKKPYASRIKNFTLDAKNSSDTSHRTEHFQSNGELYAAFRPTYPVELADSLAKLASNHQVALDVGCGNGQLTTLLSPHFEKMIGVDVSKNQLCHAQPVSNITYLEQVAEKIELADASVDLIVVAQAAHWFELESFYSEVRRIAKQDATIALISYGVPYIVDPVNSIFQQGYWQDIHEFWSPERKHVEAGYSDLYFPFSEINFPSHSIQKTMMIEEFISYIMTWSAYNNACNNDSQYKFEQFFQKLRNTWKADSCKEVVWPISVRAAYVNQ